jgi:hypothetical protein
MACRSSDKKSLNRQHEMANNVQEDLNKLSGAGFLPDNPVVKLVSEVRSKVLGRFGVSIPRVPSLLSLISGLSPGTLRVWYDYELGFFVEARRAPGTTPVYRAIPTDTAILLLKDEPDMDLAHRYMELAEYVGEG